MVTPSDLEAVFSAVSLERELRIGKQDRIGRLDETAIPWDTSGPWVDLLAMGLLARTGRDQSIPSNRKRTFSVHITHDVDRTTLLEPFHLAKSAAGILAPRRAKSLSLRTTLSRGTLLNGLERLLDYEVARGVRARFFLMSGPYGLGRHGSRTNSRWASWISSARLIQEAGMSIGLHGSFAAMDRSNYGEERERLEQAIGCAVTTHRNHYLRFDTRRICTQLQAAGIRHDFSFGYASRVGFRSSCARVHRTFDLDQQRESGLLAVPLLFMDTHLIGGDPVATFGETLLSHPNAWPFFEKVVSECLEMGADVSGNLA